jgi:hypothetical protein
MCKKKKEEVAQLPNLSIYKYTVDQCVNVASRATPRELRY